MPQLLLELFSEEIPARMQTGAARDLERMAGERLKAAGLAYEALTTFAGPRRLTLVVEGLLSRTPDRSEELKGPKVSAPEQALEGFLRKTGLTREQLTERDGVLYAVIEQKGRSTADLIPEMVEGIIRSFPWPKSMRWGTGSLTWVRPLKRILCLFDGAVVPFAVEGIQSGDVTEGHRFMGAGRPLKVRSFEDYRRQLEADFVLLDQADRKLRILDGARAVCRARGLELIDDDGLLEEVSGLAEWPTPILGEMDPSFLDLPPEVIRLSMKTHQKYFAVRQPPSNPAAPASVPPEGGQSHDHSPPAGGSTREAREGGLAPNFVVVANVEASDGGRALAAGNSRVLSARLNDARFFWDEDRKVGFEPWLKKLEGVTFHAKLGTMAERVDRIAALAREIAPLVGADPEMAATAARYAKADLASGMVGEFPELQGIMGGYYARALDLPPSNPAAPASVPPEGGQSHDHSPPVGGSTREAREGGDAGAIADAIRDHYKPQGPNDTVPSAPLTVAVALADKLDTLVGFFAIDEKPTGSKDPFALRRAALGVIRLVLENKARVSFDDLLTQAQHHLFRTTIDRYHSIFNALVDTEEARRAATYLIEPKDMAMSRYLSPDDLAVAEGWLIALGVDPSELRKPTSAESYRAFGLVLTASEHFDQSIKAVHYSHPSDAAEWPDKSIMDLAEISQRTESARIHLLAFFADRLKVLLRDQGKRHDLVDAVFALGDDDLVRIVRRVEALDAFLATDDGANLLAGYKRASNILKAEAKKGALPTGPATDLAGAPAEETALVAAIRDAEPKVETALAVEDFTAAMAALASLRAPVDAFFEAVLVNSDVPAERENRLRLLGQVRDLTGRVADFGQISG